MHVSERTLFRLQHYYSYVKAICGWISGNVLAWKECTSHLYEHLFIFSIFAWTHWSQVSVSSDRWCTWSRYWGRANTLVDSWMGNWDNFLWLAWRRQWRKISCSFHLTRAKWNDGMINETAAATGSIGKFKTRYLRVRCFWPLPLGNSVVFVCIQRITMRRIFAEKMKKKGLSSSGTYSNVPSVPSHMYRPLLLSEPEFD